MSRFCIAIPSEDGQTVSEHFGEADRFVVVFVEDGRVLGWEERSKPVHRHEPGEEHTHRPGEHLPKMIEPVRECRVFILGGIGRPGYEQLLAQGYEVFLAAGPIDQLVDAYLKGQLTSDLSRVHEPGHGHHHHHA